MPFQDLTPSRPLQPEPLSLSVGLLIGAACGLPIPALTWTAELARASTAAEAWSNAGLSLTWACLAAVVAMVLGGVVATAMSHARRTQEMLASKAASLLEENWELRARVEAPPEDHEPASASADRALIDAQARLLSILGEAQQDTAHRLRIHVQSLRLSRPTPIQGRVIDAIAEHVDGMGDLADDVVRYADGLQVAAEAQPDEGTPSQIAA